MSRTRDEYLQDITDDIRELTLEVQTSIEYTRDGDPTLHRRKGTHHGLLIQLTEALVPGSAPGGGEGRSGRPGSSSPVNDVAAGALADIARGWPTGGSWQIGAVDLRARLRAATGRRRGMPVGLTGALYSVRALIHETHRLELLEQAAGATRAYVALAKRALAYEAPVRSLRDVCCPACTGPLRVAADASSDVWCPSVGCRDAEGRRHVWPRQEWPFLLERLTKEGAA
jgi:hypothetical protein